MEKKLLIAALSALAVGSGTVGTAEQAIAQTAEERTAFEAAMAEGTVEALQEFLILFPNSVLAAQVFEELNARITAPAPQSQDQPFVPPPLDPTQRLPALDLTTGDQPITTIY